MTNDPVATQNQTIGGVLTRAMPALKLALPKSMDPERMARVALTTIRRNKDLLRCDVNSLAGAVLEAASLGLEIDSRGLAYLVPYGREATLIPGYKGLMQLAYRSGKVANIYADVVFRKEVEAGKVSINLGDDRSIRHDFDIIESAELREESKTNPPVLAYAVAVFHDGHRHFEFVTTPEVAKRKSASRAAEKGFLWTKWIEEAWKKTAIRKLCKYLDASPELMRAVTLDEQADAEIKQTFDLSESIDVDFTVQSDEQPLSEKIRGAIEEPRTAAAPPSETSPTVLCHNRLDDQGKPQRISADECESCSARGGCSTWL